MRSEKEIRQMLERMIHQDKEHTRRGDRRFRLWYLGWIEALAWVLKEEWGE